MIRQDLVTNIQGQNGSWSSLTLYCLILRDLSLKGWKSPCKHGGVAQLGEHLPCKQGVDSSILFISTIRETLKAKGAEDEAKAEV